MNLPKDLIRLIMEKADPKTRRIFVRALPKKPELSNEQRLGYILGYIGLPKPYKGHRPAFSPEKANASRQRHRNAIGLKINRGNTNIPLSELVYYFHQYYPKYEKYAGTYVYAGSRNKVSRNNVLRNIKNYRQSLI
jgi:hypothetical protein